MKRADRYTARVMGVLSTTNAPTFSLDLIERTGLSAGQMYTGLVRAERQGWVSRALGAPTTPDGPARALYALSDRGQTALPQVLEQARREPMPRRWRWSWLSW